MCASHTFGSSPLVTDWAPPSCTCTAAMCSQQQVRARQPSCDSSPVGPCAWAHSSRAGQPHVDALAIVQVVLIGSCMHQLLRACPCAMRCYASMVPCRAGAQKRDAYAGAFLRCCHASGTELRKPNGTVDRQGFVQVTHPGRIHHRAKFNRCLLLSCHSRCRSRCISPF